MDIAVAACEDLKEIKRELSGKDEKYQKLLHETNEMLADSKSCQHEKLAQLRKTRDEQVSCSLQTI